MRIEDLRKENIGEIYAWFPAKGNHEKDMILVTYPHYSTKAFYFSCQSLEQLEKSKNNINQGNTNISAIGLWFIAIEAFISSLLKIACVLKQDNFTKFKRHSLNSRLSTSCKLLQINYESLHKEGIFQKLEEFKTFRNEIFHDRYDYSYLTFIKTAFSPIPYLANQVDVLQAAIIAFEIFHAFRFVFAGLDLMPPIFVTKADSFGFIKYDILYQEVMRPLFLESLKKHNLETTLKTSPIKAQINESRIVKSGEIKFIVKAQPKIDFLHQANNNDSNIGETLFNKVRDHITINPETHFQVPDFTRKG